MYLSQALALLSIDPNGFYLPADIVADMPAFARQRIQDALRQFATNNYFHGYDPVANERTSISIPEMKKIQQTASQCCEYRLAGNHQYVRAYIGSLWLKHCKKKSLEEALVFALAVCLLHPNREFTAMQVLQHVPLLAADKQMRKRVLVQIRRLCAVYQWLCDPNGDAYAGYRWSAYVTPRARGNLLMFLTTSRSHLCFVDYRPQMIAACIPGVQRYARRHQVHMQSMAASDKAELMTPCRFAELRIGHGFQPKVSKPRPELVVPVREREPLEPIRVHKVVPNDEPFGEPFGEPPNKQAMTKTTASPSKFRKSMRLFLSVAAVIATVALVSLIPTRLPWDFNSDIARISYAVDNPVVEYSYLQKQAEGRVLNPGQPRVIDFDLRFTADFLAK